MIRLGVIGESEGNGHPYSWSAICNGYDAAAMENCGYPTIPRYLADRIWPDERLPNVAVTHIWTQDVERTRHIAKAALIETIVRQPEDMIGRIDGLLLARDDVENHAEIAAPFLRVNVPVYLDKTPALTEANFDIICAMQKRPGLIFSCTALRFAGELKLDSNARKGIGRIKHVFAVTPKKWDRYAVHVIEPTLQLLGDDGAVTEGHSWSSGTARGLDVTFESGAQAHFSVLGEVASPIAMRVIGERNWRDLVFRDSFSCFRLALAEFVLGIREGMSKMDMDFSRRVVSLVERGRQ